MVDRVTRHKEREPLLEAFGVEQEIRSTLNRRVDLPSGGYLIFDYAEAFTVVDVNTGRFVGSRSSAWCGAARGHDHEGQPGGGQGGRAPAAAARCRRDHRHRLHRHGEPQDRQQVEDALRLELERDRTKTYVVEISPLGLVEMTRQNVTDGPREVMTRKCPTCDGDGIVVPRDDCGRDRAPAARSRHARVAGQGVQGRAQREGRGTARRTGRLAAARARGGDQAALLLRPGGRRPSRPLPRPRSGPG